MATTRTMAIATTWVAVVALLLSLPIEGQSPAGAPVAGVPSVMAPSPSMDCFNALLNMSDCLSYVEAGSNLTRPEKPCCPELAGLVESNPVCLCHLLGDPGSVGIELDVSKALKLPQVCKVDTPSVSLCAAIGVPVGVPTASEPAAGGPTVSLSPSPEGLASSPASINNDKNGVTKIGATSLFCILLVGFTTVIFY